MPTTQHAASQLASPSYELGRRLLAGAEPQRWAHSIGVARLARHVARQLRIDEIVVAAADLHDIGYSPLVRRTDLHPLDGATYLRTEGWPQVICELVAHHTSADDEAAVRGLSAELEQFSTPPDDLADLLTYCDLHTSPAGDWITVAQRMVEILGRYEPDAAPHQALIAARDNLLAAVARVERRLEQPQNQSE